MKGVLAVTGLIIVLMLVVMLPSAGGAESPDQFQAVLELEKAGKLEEALKLLRAQNLVPSHATHAANLVAVLRALEISAEYQRLQEYARARRVLVSLIERLDPIEDAYLFTAVNKGLTTLDVAAQQRANPEALELLAKADTLLRLRKYEEALVIYRDVAGRKPGELPEATIQRAKQGKIHAETQQIRAMVAPWWSAPGRAVWDFIAGWIRPIIQGLQTIVQWAVYLLLAVLVIGRLRRVRRHARPETALALEDLTASPSDREAMSRRLTRDLFLQIGRSSERSGEAGQVDYAEDLDAAGLANLRVAADEFAELQSLIREDVAVQLGPVSISPKQLLSLLRVYFQRPYAAVLSGALSMDGEQFVLAIEQHTADGTPIPRKHWEERGPVRAEVIRDVATHLTFDLGSASVTLDWQSFRFYRAAVSALSTEEQAVNREELLKKVARDLQRSLQHDPANWMARFYLGTVLRKLGWNEAATQHFAFLERLITQARTPANERVDKFLKRHPDFKLVVKYNRAVALSKMKHGKAHQEAIHTLDELRSALLDGDALGATERARLEMLVSSARAAALTWRVEEVKGRAEWDPKAAQRLPQVQESISGEVRAARDWIDGFPLERAQLDWAAYTFASAVVHNAYGRIWFLRGNYDHALDELRIAVTLLPDFTEAHVSLAEVYMTRKVGHMEWPVLAEDSLGTALELNPSHRRANYLMGKLFTHAAVGRPEDAKKYLTRAAPDPKSYALLAKIFADENRLDEAVAQMRRSLSLAPQPDYRVDEFVQYVLQLADGGKADAAVIGEAARVARRLKEQGLTEGDRRRGAKLLTQVEEKLKARQSPSAGDPNGSS